MASNGPISSYQSRTSQYHCNECGVYFDSAQSLDVHLQYHKENLLTKWANQASQQNTPNTGNSGNQQHQQAEEANNNNTKIKRELLTTSLSSNTIAAPADSSDTTIINKSNNRSPDSCNSSATPDISISVGHPATPQSYHSAPSPYQNTEPTNFSPNFHNFHIKTEGSPPSTNISSVTASYPNFNHHTMHYADNQYFGMDQQQLPAYTQDYLSNKQSSNLPTNYRYHPYHHSSHFVERSAQVSSSSSNQSPSYTGQTNPPQPTPSPSPKQCDKCGFVCETPGQLIEHIQIAHPATPFTQQQQSFQFSATNQNHSNERKIKQEDEPQAEILDLDSQKVHVYQTPEEQEDALKRQQAELANLNGNSHNPHSVSAMLSWPPNSSTQHPQMQQPKIFHQSPNNPDSRIFNNASEQKIYNIQDEKLYSVHAAAAQEQKLFQPHQMHNTDFHSNNVSTTTQHENVNPNMGVPPNISSPQIPHAYRPYEHVPVQPNPPVISSTQVPNSMPPTNLPTPVGKGSTWKSNEARRPKTYNCSACNKWFTSSGHLKRHYNTTLHKNAVKSSGQPDPATLPISAHHHPTRDPNHHTNRQQHQQQQQQQQQTSQQQQQTQSQQSHDVNSQSPASLHLPTSGDDPNSDGGGEGLSSGYDPRSQHSGLLQQPPSGPYDRHPPNINSSSLQNIHNNLPHSPNLSNSLTNLSSGSPPNGEAGPSANNINLSRGLQSISTSNIPHQLTPPLSQLSNIPPPTSSNHINQLPPFNLINQPQHMMGITSTPNQIFHHPMGPPPISANYPNELSPHVTQTTVVTNNQPPVSINLTSTGEFNLHDQHQQYTMIYTNSTSPNDGPLPSFAQFALLAGIQPVQISNVGGSSSVTDSQLHQHQNHHLSPYSASSHHLHQLYLTQPDESEFILPDMEVNSDECNNTNMNNDTIVKVEPEDFSPNSHIIYRSIPVSALSTLQHHNGVSENDYHTTTSAHHQQQQHQGMTVLQPVDQNIPHEKVIIYSPTNNNTHSASAMTLQNLNHIYDTTTTTTAGGLPPLNEVMVEVSPKAQKIQNENDIETSSPLITSTGSPLNVKKQSGQNGIHKCIGCDKVFNKACYLTQHNKTFHSGDKPFKCHRCGKRFSDEDCYQSHLKKHAGEKPHKCEQCPKQFNHKTDLRRHMCLHSGFKPYVCDTCGKGFIRKDHMIKHCDTHMRKSKLHKDPLVVHSDDSNISRNIVSFSSS